MKISLAFLMVAFSFGSFQAKAQVVGDAIAPETVVAPVSEVVPALAADADLVLADARHLAVFHRFVCKDLEGESTDIPAILAERSVVFEKLQGDGMIIQFLITASFKEQNSICHYSSLLSRAIVRNALVVTESKAFSADAGVDCSAGKEMIDGLFAKASVSYTTHPIRFIGLKVPVAEANAVCGPEAKGGVRVVFERVRN